MLTERARMANEWKADYFVSVHCNAGGGTGFESFIFNGNVGQRTVAYQNSMHHAIVNHLGVRDRGKKRANFAVLRETRMSAILTENLFVDHKADAKLLKSKAFLRRIAEAHVLGLEKTLGLKKKKRETKPDLYRVIVDGKQIGAFAETQNILNAVDVNLSSSQKIEIEKV
ncbi:N-acetylmuramoyl-L-alanine amidase [Halalkalibacterium halodurans]|uniref:N-acetylmuramoyl-L-alanine amidase n=1 Tax=Halalkalibacterium halodurans TaxID=86665 RepID=UPI001FBA436F|nr:N-acetylmuramoyl-L-alanine amidase [Halalkalibacterium halodurans]MED3648612.1 N-acetylmuramoyl-L-alanine amidase [Halalkalibacterium halodurans]